MLETIPSYWIPIIIFVARICDVSLGTLRIIFVSRSMKFKAAMLGFIEVLIWIFVVAQLIQHLNNWMNYVAYAAGFSVGTYLGITLENKLKVGTVLIRVITRQHTEALIKRLKDAGVMLTSVDAEGGEGSVKIIFTVVKRRRWKEIVRIIEQFDSDAFYSIEDVKYTSSEEPEYAVPAPRTAFDRLLRIRKGI